MESMKKLYVAIGASLSVIAVGTLGYVITEGHSVFDSLWMTLITLSTIGYGDMIPQTIGGRAFTMALVLTGVGIVAYYVSTAISLIIEGTLTNTMEENNGT